METTTSTDTRFTEAELKLANDVRMACQWISRRVRFEASPAAPPHQVSVLVRLREQPRTPGELADIERVSAPSMTKTVNCLADQGLVERTPHPHDRRSQLIALTPDGEALIERTIADRDSWMARRVALLDADEQELLRRATAVLLRVVSE